MPKGFISSARNLLRIVMMLIGAAVFGFLAWGSWQLHENENLSEQFSVEGRPVVVKVATTDRKSRTWYDGFFSPVYITFNYNNRSYTTRCLQDSGWIAEGDRITLLYHHALDDFRQPGKRIHFNNGYSNQSRLLHFSITSAWTDERKWLALTLAFSAVFVLIMLGLITSLVNIPVLKHIGRFIVTVGVFGAALYFTYNHWQYKNYYNQVKDKGRPMTVNVLGTDAHARSKRNNWWYSYEASVQYGHEQKVIPIEESDYNNLKPNDQLQVLYNQELKDMMPASYTPDNSNMWVALFMWAFAIFFAWTSFFRQKKA